MKKGVEWLAMLSKENQVLFCKNRVNDAHVNVRSGDVIPIAEYLNAEFGSFEAFLHGAFIWQDSPQGHDYWSSMPAGV